MSWPSALDPRRPMGRGPYAAIGVLLFAVKHNLDRLVASAVFGQPWSVFNYLALPAEPETGGVGAGPAPSDGPAVITDGGGASGLPGPPDGLSDAGGPAVLSAATDLYLALLVLALPFVAIGTLLTLRRLRSVGWSPWLVLLFFVPVANVAFLLLLAATPPAPERSRPASTRLDAWVPRSALGSAALAVGLTAPLAAGAAALMVAVTERYGWGLFVGIPFSMGMIAAILTGWHRAAGLLHCLGVATLAVIGAGLLLLATAVEGVFCLVMAAPLGILLAWLGAALGWAVQSQRARGSSAAPPPVAAGLVVPVLLLAETAAAPRPELRPVVTSVEIAAPPARVFPHVVSFAELPPPSEWLFRAGVAYPVRARIEGRGVGAVRRCEFSTGAFVEPITTWDEPRRLAFDVVRAPEPMQEWTPWTSVRPAHLDGYFGAVRGEFRLEELGSGGTRLVGTTWYRQHIWPEAYWSVWTDAIVHRIHGRVLRHIAAEVGREGS